MNNELGNLIADDLKQAESIMQAARDHALTHIVGVGGILVTVITGFLAVVQGSRANLLTTEARYCLSAALISLVLSTVAALMILVPRATIAD